MYGSMVKCITISLISMPSMNNVPLGREALNVIVQSKCSKCEMIVGVGGSRYHVKRHT